MSDKTIEFYGSYGHVKRSSAIFYYRSSKFFKTTISFMNYWKVKRDLKVSLQATLRTMKGEVVLQESIFFEKGQVLNYSPEIDEHEFEGSVEIEVFSEVNMVIPYAAIMAIYRSKDSISLTHSYARCYEEREVSEGLTITDGEEGCWTLRDDDLTTSFCIFHNGFDAQPEQKIRLEVLNHAGEKCSAEWQSHAFDKYETVKLIPKDHIPDLISFLGGQEGSATISFKLNRSFTRMLIGNFRGDYTDVQTAHSNFNYAIKEQGSVEGKNASAIMLLPDFDIGKQNVILYPDYASGNYLIQKEGESEFSLSDNNRKIVKVLSDDSLLTIRRSDGQIPNRFVTGFICEYDKEKLPIEVSRGIRHIAEPPKRMFWGPCVFNSELGSRIILNPYTMFCNNDPGGSAVFTLFSEKSHNILEKKYDALPVDKFRTGVSLEAIFGASTEEFLGGGFGYFTFFSNFTMFDCLIIVQRKDGAIGMEHCF
jgi:hypothetical protein